PANPCANDGSPTHQLAQSASQGNDARTYRARDAWNGIIPLSHGWTWSRRRPRTAGVSEASAQTRAHRVNTRLRRAAERNASGLVERRTADRRRRYRVACVERLDLRGDFVSIGDDGRDRRHAWSGKEAARQVLQHLTRSAVVIRRVGRAAGNAGVVVV